jgi:hypothetical protein
MTALRGLRPLVCLVILSLAFATQLALDPLLGSGPDAVDLPLLVLLWFATVDRWPRILAIGSAIALARVLAGASSPFSVLLPLAVAVLWIRAARHTVDPRELGRRAALVGVALALASAAHRIRWSTPWAGTLDDWAYGIVLGSLSALLLFAILDRTAPLLRNADYPM